MIYCPQCGTPNKPNSKFCKNCAAALQPSTELRCPICGEMNPQTAETCKSCGTRLSAAANASASGGATPANAPEHIAPFNPPEMAPEPEPPPSASASSARAAFSGSSSQWLRRINKTPAESKPTEPSPAPTVGDPITPAKPAPPVNDAVSPTKPAPPVNDAVSPTKPAPPVDDWIRQLDHPAETPKPAEPASAKPQLSEIKLTGDDYDYSDIGGEVTAEMKAQLEAEAGSAQSVDDEVALAMRLLGLEAGAEVASTAAQTPSVPSPAAAEPAIPTPISQAPTESLAPALTESRAEIETPAPVSETPSAAPAEQENAEWLTRLAAASSAAVAAKIVSGAHDQAESSEPTAEISTETIPPAPTAEIPTETISTEPTAEISTETIPPAPIAEIPTETISTEPTAEISAEPIAEIPTETISPDQVAAAAALADADHIPAWLREIAPSETEADAASAAEEMPEWVRDLAPGAAVIGTTALLNQLPDLDETERGDLPEWLREPIEEPEVQSETEFAEAESDTTFAETASDASVELPPWVRAGAVGGHDPFEVVETTGPLAGVSGILPLAVALTEPHTLSTFTPPRADSGRIFQTLLAEPLAAPSRASAESAPARRVGTKHIVYLIIALAALIGLFLPPDAGALGLFGKNFVNSPSAVFYDQLNELPPSSAVLMAFDYMPGQNPELEPAARAILENLAPRQISVIALSSNPNGANLAQTLLAQTQKAHPAWTFVNLGYIPGNEIGLKALALGWLPANYLDANGIAWSQSPLAKTVDGMDDLALNILLSGDSADLNAWMTQVQPIVKTPFIAATTAALDPQARIYVNAKQLRASLRGLTGAAELELWSGISGPAIKTVNALSLVMLALAGIIIVTNLVRFLKPPARAKDT